MTPDQIRTEAHRVISGAAGLPAIGFPHDTWAMDAVVTWTRMFLENADGASNHQRSLFIRKLAAYIVRVGSAQLTRSSCSFGCAYFSRKPSALETKLTFGGAVQREHDSTYARLRRMDGPLHDTVRADLKKRLVSKPVLMAHDGFVLHQILHARHLLEAGRLAGNCLVYELNGQTLPNPAYWQPMKIGQRKMFTLSHQDKLCCLISFVNNIITDLDIIQNSRRVRLVMPLVADTLQSHHGTLWPLSANMPWPFPKAPPLPSHDPNQLQLPFWGETP